MMCMRLAAVVAVMVAMLSGAGGAFAGSNVAERPARLGFFTDTASVAAGITYLAPRHLWRRNRPAAWTPAWVAACSHRYPSFNPRTGYYISYNGRGRFCRLF